MTSTCCTLGDPGLEARPCPLGLRGDLREQLGPGDADCRPTGTGSATALHLEALPRLAAARAERTAALAGLWPRPRLCGTTGITWPATARPGPPTSAPSADGGPKPAWVAAGQPLLERRVQRRAQLRAAPPAAGARSPAAALLPPLARHPCPARPRALSPGLPLHPRAREAGTRRCCIQPRAR